MSLDNNSQSTSSNLSAAERSSASRSIGGLERGDIFKLSSGSCSVKDGCLSSVIPELLSDLDPLKPSSSLSKTQKAQSFSVIESSLSSLKDQISQFESDLKDAKVAMEGHRSKEIDAVVVAEKETLAQRSVGNVQSGEHRLQSGSGSKKRLGDGRNLSSEDPKKSQSTVASISNVNRPPSNPSPFYNPKLNNSLNPDPISSLKPKRKRKGHSSGSDSKSQGFKPYTPGSNYEPSFSTKIAVEHGSLASRMKNKWGTYSKSREPLEALGSRYHWRKYEGKTSPQFDEMFKGLKPSDFYGREGKSSVDERKGSKEIKKESQKVKNNDDLKWKKIKIEDE